MFDLNQLSQFLREAKQHTYAADSGQVSSSLTGSTDLEYVSGPLRYHDTYLGHSPFLGLDVVYENDTEVWGMNYFGYVTDKPYADEPCMTPSMVYEFLKQALRQDQDEIVPVRGPRFYEHGRWRYSLKVMGDLRRFTAEEEIRYDNSTVYYCYCHGGLL